MSICSVHLYSQGMGWSTAWWKIEIWRRWKDDRISTQLPTIRPLQTNGSSREQFIIIIWVIREGFWLFWWLWHHEPMELYTTKNYSPKPLWDTTTGLQSHSCCRRDSLQTRKQSRKTVFIRTSYLVIYTVSVSMLTNPCKRHVFDRSYV